uniref:Uncharacterized protein n=1 Tax=Anguilla anguilla TaxID=7936 RepID=A0A0E9WHR3_ANGAN
MHVLLKVHWNENQCCIHQVPVFGLVLFIAGLCTCERVFGLSSDCHLEIWTTIVFC